MARKRSKYSGSAADRYNMEVPQRPGESDLDYYNRMAKVANERLRQLNRLAKRPGYEGVLKYSYSNAMYDIREMTGADRTRTRFPTKVPKTKSGDINQRELHRMINSVKKFVESPTSTKRGIEKVYKQRTATVNQRLNLKGKSAFKWQELSRFYESEKAQTISKRVAGSDTVLRALGAIKRNVGTSKKAIQDAIQGNKKISDDFVINSVAKELLRNGINPADYFNKK